MAKVPFSKLDLKVNDIPKKIIYTNTKNENIEIEIKQYLTFEEKTGMISNIINQSIDDNGFYNSARLELYKTMEIIYAYTNLNFTAKQKENVFKTFDQLVSSGLFMLIQENIPDSELQMITSTILITIDNIYKYKNSALGIINNIVADYEGLDLDATEIQKSLADPDNLQLLKQVLSRLG